MYKNNLAMAVKADGKVLREIDGRVYLPFGTEYSIYFRNTSSKRAKVKIKVDGSDILDGASLVINAGDTAEVSRFVKNANFDHGNSLKFIEKTEKISNFRGDKAEDGLITVEYEFEKDQYRHPTAFTMNKVGPQHDYYTDSGYGKLRSISKGFENYPIGIANVTASASNYSNNLHDGAAIASMDWMESEPTPQNTSGITAPGSRNDQKFTSTSWRGSDLYSKGSMTIELKGKVEEQHSFNVEVGDLDLTPEEYSKLVNSFVKKVVTTKTKVECSMCGSEYKAGTRFCSECGTSLNVY